MLTYPLAQKTSQPLYVYFYECIKQDILSGSLCPYEKLPSKRAFAKHHQVSLITVEAAYQQLIAEGYVRSEERKGYYVNAVSVIDPPASLYDPSQYGAGYGDEYDGIQSPYHDTYETQQYELTHHVAFQQFPYTQWTKCIRKTLTDETPESLFEQCDARGTNRLRKALARYLEGTRGMHVDPECIVVGAGAQMLYLMVVQLLGMGNRIALENPGYTRLAHIYHSLGVMTEFIPTDVEGMQVDTLTTSQATIAHIMPTHQYPTGSIMSIARRYELLSWAVQKPYRYIIEDDYDAELRFSGQPIPTLSNIDVSEKVLYVNTFAKTLGSAFRIGYMVLPPHLLERFLDTLGFYSCPVSTLDQLALARFIESGEYERHNNRLKTHYKAVASALAELVDHYDSAKQARLCQVSAGTHCLLCLPTEMVVQDMYDGLFTVLEQVHIQCLPLDSFAMNSSYDASFVASINAIDCKVYVLDFAQTILGDGIGG